ncbi:hypothetical protein GCM10007385_44310 [Tateyamaria omphalii]|nr:hypothetical protein GCM10007385_44310 [Tateyamaria omphalii]
MGQKTASHGFGRQFVQIAEASDVDRRQIVLVPGAAVPLLALDLPEKLRGIAREQVARRQLQDRLSLGADDIEMRPFHGLNGKGWHQVLVADTELLQTWRSQIPRGRNVVLPDYLALPTANGVWAVHADNTGVSVRLGPDDGFGGQADAALAALSEGMADPDQKPKCVLMVGEPWPELVALAQDNNVTVVENAADVAKIEGLEVPTVLTHGELACNLSRDPALVRGRLRNQIKPWRWPVALLMIAIALWTASDLLEIQRLRAERIAIQTATEQVVRDVFVPNGPILDVRSQVQQAEAAMRQSSVTDNEVPNALALFERVGVTIHGSGARMLRASSLDGTRLDLLVETSGFAAADALTSALAGNGLEILVVGSRRTQDGAGVRTELQLISTGQGGQL